MQVRWAKTVYERPISASNSKSATRDQRALGRSLSESLKAVTSTFMLRRLQRDVLNSELPPRTEALVFCRPSEAQRRRYKELTRVVSRSGCEGGVNGAGVSADALTLLTKVRKLCSHPRLLLEDDSDDIDFGNGNHDDGDDDDDVHLSGKLSALEFLLSSIRTLTPNDKVVVISNFTSALTVVKRSLLKP